MMEWVTSVCFGYVAGAGLVIKEGGVVAPPEQQGTGFQNNCTCSLAISWEALGKNDAREQSGQTDFSCRLWSVGCSLGTSVKCICNLRWYYLCEETYSHSELSL